MLGLVAALALVLMAIQVTSKPEFWAWMFPEQQNGGESAQNDAPSKQDIDYDVRLEDELNPGEFLSRADSEQAGDTDHTPQANGSRKAVEAPAVARIPDSAGHAPASLPPDATIDIDAALLQSIEDNTVGIRRGETDAYFHTLAKVRDLPTERLRRQARSDVSYTVLMVDPADFRGKLLTIEGQVRRLVAFEAGENDHGIERLYEVWLFTQDSGTDPYRVVCTRLPEDIPRGEEIREDVQVRVTGYFFKKQGYQAQRGLHVAPLILAKTLQWSPPQPATARPGRNPAPWVLGGVLLVGLALAVTLWRLSRSDRDFQEQHLKRVTEVPPEDVEALKHLEATDPGEMLRRLSEQEDTSGAAGSGDASDDSDRT